MNEITISGFYDEISSALSTQIAVLHQLGETYMCPRNVDGKNIADYTFEEFKEKIFPVLKKGSEMCIRDRRKLLPASKKC